MTPILGLAKRDLLTAGVVAFALLCAGVVTIRIITGAEMDRVSARAQAEFPGDRLDALLAVAQSPGHSLAFRNRAVWAIGRLGDARAVQPLEGLLTGGHAIMNVSGVSARFGRRLICARHARGGRE